MFEIELGEWGEKYLRDHLLAPGFTLGRLVADRTVATSGRCYAIVPDGTSWERAQELSAGGYGSIHQAEALELVSHKVVQLMETHGEVGLIAEEGAMTPEDNLAHGGLPRFACGHEVYLHTTAPDRSIIAEILSWADAVWTMNAVVARSVERLDLPKDGSSVQAAQLSQIAAGCLLVIASAYDGESYVLFEPESG